MCLRVAAGASAAWRGGARGAGRVEVVLPRLAELRWWWLLGRRGLKASGADGPVPWRRSGGRASQIYRFVVCIMAGCGVGNDGLLMVAGPRNLPCTD
jgi:hypothetical protein